MTGRRHTGSTLTEFVVIAPLLLLIGLTGVQLVQLQQARLNLDYAAYEAVRAGSRHNANPAIIREGFIRGLLPFLASTGALPGHPEPGQLVATGEAIRRAVDIDNLPMLDIQILNPGKEAFDDFADPMLQRLMKIDRRVIPNDSLDRKALKTGPHSGLNIQDANQLRLRIIFGFEPHIPVVRSMFTQGLAIFSASDPVKMAMLDAGRIPVEIVTTLPMLSPVIESNGIKAAPSDEGQVKPPQAESGATSDSSTAEGPQSDGAGSAGGTSGGATGYGQPCTGTDEDMCCG